MVCEDSRRKQSLKKTTTIIRTNKTRLRLLAEEYPEQPGIDYHRPKVHGECLKAGLGLTVPCPFVSCKYHLYLDVNEAGSITTYSDVEPQDMEPHKTCTLRAAETEKTLEEIGKMLGITWKRVGQILNAALEEMRRNSGGKIR